MSQSITPRLWLTFSVSLTPRFATITLHPAFEATLLAALLNGVRGWSARNLFKCIGCGAFGNDDGWISAAILRALRLVADQDLDMRMVSYCPSTSALRVITAAWAAGRVAA